MVVEVEKNELPKKKIERHTPWRRMIVLEHRSEAKTMEQALTCSGDDEFAILDGPNKRCGTGCAKGPHGRLFRKPLASRLSRHYAPIRHTKLVLHSCLGNARRRIDKLTRSQWPSIMPRSNVFRKYFQRAPKRNRRCVR